MPLSAVEQLDVGLRVKCADGEEIVCQPLTLRQAMRIRDLWNKWQDPEIRQQRGVIANGADEAAKVKAAERLAELLATSARARLDIVAAWAELFPQLVDHISPGDIERLVPDFFWNVTGAAVVVPETTTEAPPTGTASGSPTLPSGETSPA